MEEISAKLLLLPVASAICLAFGGLQNIAVLQLLQPLLLLQFFHHARVLERKWASLVWLLLFTLLTQVGGYTIAYLAEFNDPDYSFLGVAFTLFTSFLVWVLLLFVYVTAAAYELRFPAAVLSHPFAFPILYLMVWHLSASFSPIGTTGNPAYSQLAFRPVVLTASLWGVDGIVFFMTLTATLLHQRLQLRQEAEQDAWKVGVAVAANDSGHPNDGDTGDTQYKVEIENGDDSEEPLYSERSRGTAASGAPSNPKGFAKTVRRHDKLVKIWFWIVVLSLVYSGSRQAVFSGRFFEKSITETASPTVEVSCVLRQPDDNIFGEHRVTNASLSPLDGPSQESLWDATAERVKAGDAFILWSETATVVDGQQGEQKLLSRAREILSSEAGRREGNNKIKQWTTPKPSVATSHVGSYLGLSYSVKHEGKAIWSAGSASNTFTLMLPDGSIGFQFQKASPVPYVEPETVAGSGELKAVDTHFGRVSAAICFDLQFPLLLKQAAYLGTDILLQPSWTWGPMANNQLYTDAFRAVENGFTLLRCSSMGLSAVVTPYYEVIDLRESTNTIEASVVTMQLPLSKKIWTLYPWGGFVFGILVSLVAVKYLFMAWLPLSWVVTVSSIMPGAVNDFFVGDKFEEEVIGKKVYRKYKTRAKSSKEWTVARRPSLLPSRSLSSS